MDLLAEFEHWPVEVAADRAYTMYAYWLYQVAIRGARNVLDLRKDQRRKRPGPKHSVLIDGIPILDLADPELLPRPGFNTSKAQRLEMQRNFARRALCAYLPNGGDPGGARHFLSPLGLDGRLRPALQRLAGQLGVKPHEEPRAPRGKEAEYAEGITLYPPDLLTYTESVYGTDAHYADYTARRQAVELAFSYLSTKFTTVDWRHAQVVGVERRALLLAFTLAGANCAILADFHRARAAETAARERKRHRRAPRRPRLSDRPEPSRPGPSAPSAGHPPGRGRPA